MTDQEPTLENPMEFAGVPDHFQRLWTPHRAVYMKGEAKPKDSSSQECPFCRAPEKTDEDALIVYRGKTCYVILNLYPYNPGHTLICPYRHVASYIDLDQEETVEMAVLTQKTIKTLKQVANPAGFNLGMNQGAVAGAGIAAHAHQHVVPRYLGDANFLPIIGRTKTVGKVLNETRAMLASAWEAVNA